MPSSKLHMQPEQGAAQALQKLSDNEIRLYVGIGFCKPRYYRPEVWRRAKRVMEIACKLGLARPYNFGRGCGKYITDLRFDEVERGLIRVRDGVSL